MHICVIPAYCICPIGRKAPIALCGHNARRHSPKTSTNTILLTPVPLHIHPPHKRPQSPISHPITRPSLLHNTHNHPTEPLRPDNVVHRRSPHRTPHPRHSRVSRRAAILLRPAVQLQLALHVLAREHGDSPRCALASRVGRR